MKKLVIFLILFMFVSSADAILVENGATNITTYFVMRDRTAGTVDEGVTIANLEMYYITDANSLSADVFVGTHGAADDAHTDGECIHVDWGVYRVDWPDSAFRGGTRVQLIVVDGDAGAFTEIMEVELSAPVDAVLVNSATPETSGDFWDVLFADHNTANTFGWILNTLRDLLF